jgi:glycosyltransferase involved in cell wall biosynthesis
MKPQAAPPSLSVIVPIGARRAADLGALYREYRASIAATGATHEFIFVLDGPRPEERRALETLLRAGEEFTIVNLTRNFGEAAALTAGFERSSGGTIVTLPAYQQVEPGDIRKLLAALSTTDLAIGYRSPRHGNALDRVRRSAFHGLVNFVTGARLRDLGCGVRAMRRQVLEEIDLYGDQHRFMPILAMRLGFRVSEIPMRQSTQDRHGRVYRPREYVHHLLDLFSIFFLMRFTKKPLRFFGMLGATTFGVGAVLIAYLGMDRLLFSEPLADRPALLLAALLLVLGMQIFALGLLGELIIFTHARGLKDYRVEEIIQYPDAVAVSDSGSDCVPGEPTGADPEMRATAPPAVTA